MGGTLPQLGRSAPGYEGEVWTRLVPSSLSALVLLGALGVGAYLGWAYLVSAHVEGHVTQYEYDEHGCPSLVIRFTDPSNGLDFEKRTRPDTAHKTPHKQIGEAIPLLVPPGGYALIDEPGADCFAVGLLVAMGLGLLLWTRSQLKEEARE